MGKFKDKVVIVTGAGGGMGAATALAFAKEGAKLAIVDVKEEKLHQVAIQCQQYEGSEVLELVFDLLKYENLEQIIDKTVEKFDRIDILVNNAGVGEVCPVADCKLESFQMMFDLNVRAPFFLSKFSLPHLKKTKGCVINVSSRLSTGTATSFVPYSMTKSALDKFTRGFSAESVPFGVRVNCINPGLTDTDFFNRIGLSVERFAVDQPLGLIKPEQVAEGILFIASCSHMTGSCVVLDAGGIPERH